MTILLQFAINIRKSHRQHHCSLQLLCEDLVLFLFINFVLHPNPKKYLTYSARQIKKPINRQTLI